MKQYEHNRLPTLEQLDTITAYFLLPQTISNGMQSNLTMTISSRTSKTI